MNDFVRSVSTRELKTHLSHHLRAVSMGHTVEITSHRKPIARLVSAESDAMTPYERAVASGEIRPSSGGKILGSRIVLPPTPGVPYRSMSDIVIEDRGPY
jgi:prevent-host-death family protein